MQTTTTDHADALIAAVKAADAASIALAAAALLAGRKAIEARDAIAAFEYRDIAAVKARAVVKALKADVR